MEQQGTRYIKFHITQEQFELLEAAGQVGWVSREGGPDGPVIEAGPPSVAVMASTAGELINERNRPDDGLEHFERDDTDRGCGDSGNL